MREIAYAKINLGLDILGKRDDGYHQVNMIMQSVSLADTLEFTKADDLMVTTDRKDLACDASNLAWRAAELFSQVVKRPPKVHIHIIKKIFMAAGLAGGSSDAAAVLRGLNRFWQVGMSASDLEALGAQLGSDVPFCIRGGTVKATGRGEILQPLLDVFPLSLLLVKPQAVEVSTAWVYNNYQAELVRRHPDFVSLLNSLKTKQLQPLLAGLGNVLETVTLPACPEIAVIKEELLAQGALAVLMSGSGPTVIGFVKNQADAKKIAEGMQKHPNLDIAVVETVARRDIL